MKGTFTAAEHDASLTEPARARAGDVEVSPFYIESKVSFQEQRLRTLKHGHTFGMFDPRGDISSADGSSEGIYHHDTRHL